MGTVIKIAGLDAESDTAAGYISPVSRGLEAIHFLNGSSAKIARNFAVGKDDGVTVGAPAILTSSYAELRSGVSWVQTSMAEPLEGTFFIICKATDNGTPSGAYPAFFSSLGGKLLSDPTKDAPGIGLLNVPSLRFAQGVSKADGSLVPAYNAMSQSFSSTWALYVCVLKATAFGSLTNKTTGTVGGPQDEVNLSGRPRAQSNAKIKLGSATSAYTGVCQLAAFQAHSVVLTDAEIAKVVADLRAYALRKGITV